jgi:hypothetical protein
MKTQKGFAHVALFVLALAVLAVGAIAYVRIVKNDSRTSTENATTSQQSGAGQEITYPDDWREFRRIYEGGKNTYVAFWAPRKWVDMQTVSFDDRGDWRDGSSYFYIKAAAEPDFVFGAPEPNYTPGERGGALTDATGFNKVSSGYTIHWLNSSDAQPAENYNEVVSAKLPAIANYDVRYYEQNYMHAIIKVTGRVPVLNFVVKQGVMTQSEFELLVKSVFITDKSINTNGE